MLSPEDDTQDVQLRASSSCFLFAEHQPKFRVQVGAATHPGKVRVRNEDHYAVSRRSRSCQLLLTNLDPNSVKIADDESYAMIVADGMGGAAFGEFASRLALQVMFELAGRASSWLMRLSEFQHDEVRLRVQAYLEEMHTAFRDYCRMDPRLTGMGTTWTSAHLFPPHAILVHIGDSRGYLYRHGRLKQVTRDQTLAQDLLDAGAAPENVRGYRHVLTNNLSAEAKEVSSDIIHLLLESGDRLLLCTDGLTDMLDDQKIAEILQTPDPQATCDQLVARALDCGGKDNITVIVGDLMQLDRESA